MKADRQTIVWAVVGTLVLMASAWPARAAIVPVTGWAVHNGTATIPTGPASNPTFAGADNMTLMAPFDAVSLVNDGDFVEATTTLTMSARTANTGVNGLNTQLRVGLFNGPSGAIVASDIPNVGFIIEYTNLTPGGLIREQTSATQVNPFTSPTNIGTGSLDPEGNSIRGANPGPVTFALRLTRNAGKIDLLGSITGTDSGASNAPYNASYSVSGYSSATFPADGTFTFNRIGLFLGGNVDSTSSSLSDSSITTVPEPTSIALAGLALGGLLASRRIAPRARRCPLWRTRYA